MSNPIEGSPLRKIVNHEPNGNLSQLFPGKTYLLPRGSRLYHYSNSPENLIGNGRFDPSRSNNEGAFFFSDVPSIRANTSVEALADLIMFSYDELLEAEIERLKLVGKGDFWTGGMNLGFDGRTFKTPDPFVEDKTQNYGTEIVIFRASLPKLGNIATFVPED